MTRREISFCAKATAASADWMPASVDCKPDCAAATPARAVCVAAVALATRDSEAKPPCDSFSAARSLIKASCKRASASMTRASASGTRARDSAKRASVSAKDTPRVPGSISHIG